VRWPHPCQTPAVERLVTLGAGDAGEVLTLQRAAYVTEAQAHGDLQLPPLRQSLSELCTELGRADVLAVGWRDDTGRLVAAVRATVAAEDGAVAEIGRLTVVPDRQGQGLGSRLLDAVEDRLPAGVREVRLFTGERSEANLRLYRRHGYTETHRTDTPAGYALVHLSKPREGRSRRRDGPVAHPSQPWSGAGEDDESLGGPGHGDVAVDRSFDARAELLGVDEDDQVELEPLRRHRGQRPHA